MNTNEKFVVTINRELGSGGRTIGRMLAEKLGVPFYDKILIKSLEEKYNLSVEEIEKMKGKSRHWWSDFKLIIPIGPTMRNNFTTSITGEEPDFLTTDDMFKAEQEILEGIAADESCVVAGRSGFHIFRNHPNHLRIFIQASMPFRQERIARKQGKTPEEALKIIEKVDKMRENYVQKYTKTSRYDTRNYDLVITTDGKTEEEIVALILQFIGQKS